MIVLGPLLIALGACSSRSQAVSGDSSMAAVVGVAVINDDARAVLREVNRHRQRAGLRLLDLDPLLGRAAQAFAREMEKGGFFSHISPDGRGLKDRLASEGVRYTLAAENIARGEMDAVTAVDFWMESKGHRANILNPRLRRIGVGHSGDVWVQEFSD